MDNDNTLELITIGACAGALDEITLNNFKRGVNSGHYDILEFYKALHRFMIPVKDMEIGEIFIKVGVYLELLSKTYEFDNDEWVIRFDYKNLDIFKE